MLMIKDIEACGLESEYFDAEGCVYQQSEVVVGVSKIKSICGEQERKGKKMMLVP